MRVTLELTDGPKDRIVESIDEGLNSHNREITMSDLIDCLKFAHNQSKEYGQEIDEEDPISDPG